MDHGERSFEHVVRVVACTIAVIVLCSCATAPTPPRPVDPALPPDYGTRALCTPPEEVLYERTAVALAKLEYPRFHDLTSGAVICAFSMAFDGGVPREVWVAALRERVRALSKGEVELGEVPSEEISTQRVKGRAAYLRLVHRDGRVRKVILGPYRDPIVYFSE